MKAKEIRHLIHQKKMARETWFHTRSQAEAMISGLTHELVELERLLANTEGNCEPHNAHTSVVKGNPPEK